ncbi:M56 family metallopeptidase [Nesterenkonia haasae]|uniref:M56 family metallopeptidase n=1 Tax=Nesterenkonia haasae TaxID=2587813 RepID=UPI002E285DEA|nr:M56 family metallopeptidase [Nesterenkonia haasae]
MELLALFLAALAVILAIPVPKLLHTASFRGRSPWAAMVLWQAIALAGGLSMVGAPIIYGLAPFGDSLPHALGGAVQLTLTEDYESLGQLDVHPQHIFALCLGLLLGGHLVLTLARTYFRVLGARRRHRQLVDLLSTPLPNTVDDADTQVIEHETPLAYCLPGRTNASSVTVLSRGLLNTLSESELGAVVAHEQTHLRQRHHLLTVTFEAWYRALPWLPTNRYGREAVLELTEMLADDGALAQYSPETLLRSLALSSFETASHRDAPGSALEVDEDVPATSNTLITGARLQRLLAPTEPLGKLAMFGVVSSSAALLAVPTGLLLLS